MTAFFRNLAGTALVAAALLGCRTIGPQALPVDIHAAMAEQIDPAAVIVWSIGSRAMSEASGSRTTRMDERSWNALEAAADRLALHAGRLANAGTLRVGAHNDELAGFATGAEIQARIDEDPAGFRRLAGQAADHAANLAAAAEARDILRSEALTKSLYDNCRACHSRYWETSAR